MNFEFTPYVRHASKNSCFTGGKYVVSLDCRLIYVSSGNGVFIASDQKYKLTPGTLIYCQYGVPWRLSSDEDMQFYTVNFDFDFQFSEIPVMSPVLAEDYDPEKALKCSDSDLADFFSGVLYLKNAQWAEIDLRIIYNENLKKGSGYAQIQSSHLKITLINIYRHSNKKSLFVPICKKVESLIHSHLKVMKFMNLHPAAAGAYFLHIKEHL